MELDSRSFVKGFRALLSFFTTLPVGTAPLSEAAREFYLVNVIGLIEGFITGVMLYMFSYIVKDQMLLAVLYLVLHVVLTGGLHLEGFADYSDAIGAHKRGVEAVRIIKDPRRGSFALILLLLNMISTFSSIIIMLRALSPGTLIPILTWIYILAAESMYILCVFGLPEPYAGISRDFVESAKRRKNIVKNIIVTFAIFLTLLLLFDIHPLLIIFTTLATVITCLAVLLDVSKRLGFVNGDALGFCYEITRVVNMVIASAISQYL